MDIEASGKHETGLVVISRSGAQLAEKLAPALTGRVSLHIAERYAELAPGTCAVSVQSFPLPLRPVIGELFTRYSRLVLFMPVGAAVRLLAPLLQHKHHDPAVVCVDDGGRFVVSLLSGHIGGADKLAEEVANILGATPVITSASYVRGTLAVDLLGREFGWHVEADSGTITRVSAAVVNGEPVGVMQDAGERDWWPGDTPMPENVRKYVELDDLLSSDCTAALLISDRRDIRDNLVQVQRGGTELAANTVVYRPQCLVVGMGCRRGVTREHLEDLLSSTLENNNLSRLCIKCIATAEIKQDEAGMLELAEKLNVPLVCFAADELNGIFGTGMVMDGDHPCTCAGGDSATGGGPTPSEKARRLVGVWGVSEPSALLASGADRLLVKRQKTDRATIAIARIPFNA